MMTPRDMNRATLGNGSKTHLFLSPFFVYIYGLKVQFNAMFWNLYPDLCFVGN